MSDQHLVEHLFRKYKCFVRNKSDAIEMESVAKAFGVLQLFGVNVPTETSFMEDYWTTIGPIIYTPRGERRSLGDQRRVLTHEIGHVIRFYSDPFKYPVAYATKEGRAEIEAYCERGAMEIEWLRTGRLYTLPNLFRHGYALDDGHVTLANDLLEQAATSVESGIISTPVGIEARDWMRANAPEMLWQK